MPKYYIKKINKHTGNVEYKQYKCSDGFNKNKSICWQFSKQGGIKIIERLKYEYRRNICDLVFILEEA